MILLIIVIAALVGYLVLGEKYMRLREVCRLVFFAALLVLFLQYGTYFNFSIKEVLR
jgi:hypothetical protein